MLAIMSQAILISILVFVLIGALLAWSLSGSDLCALTGIGSCPTDAATGATAGALVALILAWFLFPAVAITIIATSNDRVARAVEERHYPDAACDARSIGVATGLLLGLKSGGRLLAFNLLAMPFYLLLLVTGIGPLILFVIVNGIAFGRDVAELAAARHGDRIARRAWLKETRRQQHLIGLAVSILFLVPLANLLAPVIGAAAGIHLFNETFSTAERASRRP